MNEQKRDALAEALRGHQIKSTGLGEWTCSCTPREWRPTSTRVRHYADALLPLVDTWLAEAEQRGREDNTDHGMCYVSGGKALEARLAEAEQRGLAIGWDKGYESGRDDELFYQRGLSTDSDAHEFPHNNPYRVVDSHDTEEIR